MDRLLTTDELCQRLGKKSKWYILKRIREVMGPSAVMHAGHKTVLVKESIFNEYIKREDKRFKKRQVSG